MNLPNKITVLRIVLIPLMIAFFFLNMIPYNLAIASAIFIIAAMTDFLDGYIARKYNLVTNLGKFLDPIADKVLVVTAFLLILEANLFPPIYGAIGVTIIVAREFMVSAFRLIAASSGLVIAADRLGKIKTIFQDICIPFIMLSTTFAGLGGAWVGVHNFLVYGGYITFGISVILTVWSGVMYIVRNIAVLKSTD